MSVVMPIENISVNNDYLICLVSNTTWAEHARFSDQDNLLLFNADEMWRELIIPWLVFCPPHGLTVSSLPIETVSCHHGQVLGMLSQHMAKQDNPFVCKKTSTILEQELREL